MVADTNARSMPVMRRLDPRGIIAALQHLIMISDCVIDQRGSTPYLHLHLQALPQLVAVGLPCQTGLRLPHTEHAALNLSHAFEVQSRGLQCRNCTLHLLCAQCNMELRKVSLG